MKKIYCKKVKRQRTIKEFFKKYYNLNNPATYYVDTDILECGGSKNRSISALYNLIKSYYPSTSFKKAIRIMNDVCVKQDNGVVFPCADIGKTVITKKDWLDVPSNRGKDNTFILNSWIELKGENDTFSIRDLYNIIQYD